MKTANAASQKRFATFALLLLAYNIPVILWGAYVRLSFSGDGCGANWPFCNGQVIPHAMATPMIVEFTHRMMTSLDVFGTIGLVAWAFLAFPRYHAARLYSVLSLVFLFVEALLGAGLVLFRKVAHDHSAGRAWYLSAHLVNTMLLMAMLTITAWLAYRNIERIRLRAASGKLWLALLVALSVSVTGAIAALGDMLFPASSLRSGIGQDFSAASSLLLRLRMIHPVIAILGAAYLIWMALSVMRRQREQPRVAAAASRIITVTLFQLAAGAINLTLLAPAWMQLTHLLIADVLWLCLMVLMLECAAAPDLSRTSSANASSEHFELVAGNAQPSMHR